MEDTSHTPEQVAQWAEANDGIRKKAIEIANKLGDLESRLSYSLLPDTPTEGQAKIDPLAEPATTLLLRELALTYWELENAEGLLDRILARLVV